MEVEGSSVVMTMKKLPWDGAFEPSSCVKRKVEPDRNADGLVSSKLSTTGGDPAFKCQVLLSKKGFPVG